jgi:hypothetical protein
MNQIRDIRTQDGWMDALAKAITESDLRAIEQLRALSTEWLQPESARMAQYNVLDAAADAIQNATPQDVNVLLLESLEEVVKRTYTPDAEFIKQAKVVIQMARDALTKSKLVQLPWAVLAAIKTAKDLIFATSVQIMDHGRVECGTTYSRALIMASDALGKLIKEHGAASWPWLPVTEQTRVLVKGKLCVTSFTPVPKTQNSLPRHYAVEHGVAEYGFREAEAVLVIEAPAKDTKA